MVGGVLVGVGRGHSITILHDLLCPLVRINNLYRVNPLILEHGPFPLQLIGLSREFLVLLIELFLPHIQLLLPRVQLLQVLLDLFLLIGTESFPFIDLR